MAGNENSGDEDDVTEPQILGINVVIHSAGVLGIVSRQVTGEGYKVRELKETSPFMNILKIGDIVTHWNQDSLEFASVEEYQKIVQKSIKSGNFKLVIKRYSTQRGNDGVSDQSRIAKATRPTTQEKTKDENKKANQNAPSSNQSIKEHVTTVPQQQRCLDVSSIRAVSAIAKDTAKVVGSTVIAPVIAPTNNANSNAAVIAKDTAKVGSTVIAPVIAPTNNANSNAAVIAKVSRTVVAPVILTTSSANSNAAVIANEIAAVGSTVVAPVIATTHNANSNAAVIAKDIAAVGSTVIAPVIAPTNNANSNASVIAKVSRTVVAPVVARTSSVNSNASVIENEIAAVGSTVAAPVVARTNNANSNAAVIARDTAAVGRTVVAPAIAPTSTANSNAAVIAKDIAKVGSTAGVGVQRKRTPAKTFDEQFDLLKEFKEQHGHCKPGKTDVSLNNWCSNVKYAYRSFQRGDNKGIKINEERIRRLEEIGFPFSAIHEDAVKASIIAAEDVNSNVSDVQNGTEKDDTAKADSSGADENPIQLDQRIEALKIFKEQHGHCNATGGLGTWCRAVRNAHNSLQRAGIRMEEDLLRRLEEIGFDFNPEQKSQRGQHKRKAFDEQFDLLKEFKKQHGHCKPGKTDVSLNNWCSNVKYAHRSLQRGESKGIKLDEERIRRLEQIGFHFDSIKIPNPGSPGVEKIRSSRGSFDKNLEDLRKFKEIHGHCNPSKQDDGSLGQWCANIRAAYGYKQRGESKKGMKLDDDRIRRLEEMGFLMLPTNCRRRSTSPHITHDVDHGFDLRLQELRAYKKENGHCNPRICGRNLNYASLTNWCCNLRSAYKCMQSGQPSKGLRLTNYRIRCLDDMGFQWTIRGAKGSSPVETMDNNLQTPDTQLQQVSISVSIIPEQKLGVSMMKNVETSGYEVMALSKESPLVGALNVGDIITHLNDQRLCVLDDEQVQEMMQRNSERGGEIRVLFSRKNLWKELLLDRSSRSIECPSSFTTLGLVLRYSQACKGLVVFHVSDSSPFQGKMKEGDAITHLNSTSLAQCLPPEFVAKIRSSTEKESILSVSRVKDFENVKEFCARQKKKKIPVFKDSENIYRGAGNIAFTGRMTVEGLIVTKIDSSSMESEPFRVGDLILKIDGNTASNSFVNFSDNQVHEIVFRSLDTNPMPLSQSSREGGGDGTLESEPLSQSSKEGGGDGNLEVELVIAPKSIESVFLPSEMPNIKIASLPVCHAFIVNDTESEAKADEKNKNLQETARRKNLRKRKIRTAGKTAKRRKAPVYSGISVDFGGGWTEEVYKKDSDGSKYKYWFSPVKKYRFRTKKSVRLFEDALTRCNNEDEAFEMIKKSLR